MSNLVSNLDEWFSNLELETLLKMFFIKAGQDANDFIDDCDSYWYDLDDAGKRDFYNMFHTN